MSESGTVARLQQLRGNVHVDVLQSQALRGNPLGDPAARPVVVYTPPGYDASASRRYPALYVLHGYTGDAAALLGSRPWERNVVQRADALIEQGSMPPCVLVLVDGFTRLGGSQYVDSMHNGAYATYTAREVVDHVDRAYRTVARESGRAVLGKSSGGFGAVHLCMEHPGVFAAFACHSGDSYFEYAHTRSFPDAHRTLERFDWDIQAFVEAFEGKHKRSTPEYLTIEMLGYAAAYSPRSATPFDLDLPFRRDTGALDEEVFARWLRFDPARRCLRKKAELARLRLRYIDCGTRDEYGLDVGARVMAARMREIGLGVRHEEFEDDHRSIAYRYDISLPALAGVLESE